MQGMLARTFARRARSRTPGLSITESVLTADLSTDRLDLHSVMGSDQLWKQFLPHTAIQADCRIRDYHNFPAATTLANAPAPTGELSQTCKPHPDEPGNGRPTGEGRSATDTGRAQRVRARCAKSIVPASRIREHEGALRAIPQGSDVVTRKYTEADIAWPKNRTSQTPRS